MSKPKTPIGDPREPDLSFHHAMIKVRWAEFIINQVNAGVNAAIDAYQQAGILHIDYDIGLIKIENRPVDLSVALMSGDAVFNLRSALDCCWMGLKRAIDATASKGTLPRAGARNELVSTLANASVEQAFQGSDSFVLDKLRPYQAGNELLWFIAQVDNWNKHNMLITTMQRTLARDIVGTTKSNCHFHIDGNQFVGDAPFEMRLGSAIELHNEPNVTVDVILISRKPEDKRPLLPFLNAALKDTHEAVQRFISTFGKKAGNP